MSNNNASWELSLSGTRKAKPTKNQCHACGCKVTEFHSSFGVNGKEVTFCKRCTCIVLKRLSNSAKRKTTNVIKQ